mmetsp:Transcript_129501/g.228949  ORF Transcript_129501/g.228949 Transcript_129501/m.228949 type:complete len:93 (+) Transcript_129501:98-376(+)
MPAPSTVTVKTENLSIYCGQKIVEICAHGLKTNAPSRSNNRNLRIPRRSEICQEVCLRASDIFPVYLASWAMIRLGVNFQTCEAVLEFPLLC